jgi:hypothetical protein
MRTGASHLPVFALILAACGEPAAVTPPQPTETPSAAPAPTAPPPEPSATAAAAPASASASAAPATPPPRQSSGRPMVLKSDPSEITDTFGTSPGAKLVLGSDKDEAVLRVPEGSLNQGTNITFKIDARGGKSTGAPVGKIYQILPMIPPSQTPAATESVGPPFVLELPAGSKKDANLAIGVADDKGKVTWTIVAPKRIDDARNVAIFELGTLPFAWLHVTTKPPTGEKK